MATTIAPHQQPSQQLGYMVIQDGAIVKSEGELVNAERLASVVQRMVAVGPIFPSTTQNNGANGWNNATEPSSDLQQFDQLSIVYPDHQYDIVVGSGGSGISVSGNPGKRAQQHRQIIYVVKRALPRLTD